MDKIYPLLFPATWFGLLAIERLLPHLPQPALRGRWVVKCVAFFVMAGFINSTIPPALGAALAPYRLFDLSGLGLPAQLLIGVLAASFVGYWNHRAFHRITLLWRAGHQMHHSVERIDIAGFAYAHPIEIAVAASIGPVVATVVGVGPIAAMIVGYFAFVRALFEHLDCRTPRWLGVIFQRPEMHAIHHQRGVHAYNYGLPLWDMVFGTFRNPVTVTAPMGFWDGAEKRVGAMLLGRDVSRM